MQSANPNLMRQLSSDIYSCENARQCPWQGTVASLPDQLWDVAVVGAGPAGATAAAHLARFGHRVILLDKEPFPRDKVCGDGLLADAIGCLERLNLSAQVRAFGCTAPVARLYSSSRRCLDIPGTYVTIKRRLLDTLLAEQAVRSGASFCRATVQDITLDSTGTLRLSMRACDEVLRARIGVLATGANIELPRKLGLVTRPAPSAIALRCYITSSVKIDMPIVSYDRSILPGYAWIFPLGGDEYNVGCGARCLGSSGLAVNLRETFRTFITEFPLAQTLMRGAHAVSPLRGAMLRSGLTGSRTLGGPNLLLIGEAVGATLPFTGEGIGKAMETAEVAAASVHRALTSSDGRDLTEFPRRLAAMFGPRFRAYQVAEDWLSRPWVNDFVIGRARRSKFVRDSFAGILNETVDPQAVFSWRGMIRAFLG